jgi:Recombination endonuclease VII
VGLVCVGENRVRGIRGVFYAFGVKLCAKCKLGKPVEAYRRSAKQWDGLDAYCRECRNTYMRAYMRGRNYSESHACFCGAELWGLKKFCSDACRNAWRQKKCSWCDSPFVAKTHRSRACSKECQSRLRFVDKYDVSVAQYKELVRAHNGLCGACGKPFGSRGAQVDHCHDTGRVRGLLCTSCNLAIGHAQDDPETQFAQAAYLAGSRLDLREWCIQ